MMGLSGPQLVLPSSCIQLGRISRATSDDVARSPSQLKKTQWWASDFQFPNAFAQLRHKI
jgi:hypothetical protein